VDGFWAGVILVVLTFAAFSLVWRVEDRVLRGFARPELQRIRVVGMGLAALALLIGWPVPNTNSGDLAQLATGVLSVTALVVICQVAAILGFVLGRWVMRRLPRA
jgi:hypothetical protein